MNESSCHASSVKDVLVLQKKALQVISGKPRLARPIFKELSILTVYGQFIFKMERGLIVRWGDVHGRDTRVSSDLCVIFCRLNRLASSFPAVQWTATDYEGNEAG